MEEMAASGEKGANTENEEGKITCQMGWRELITEETRVVVAKCQRLMVVAGASWSCCRLRFNNKRDAARHAGAH